MPISLNQNEGTNLLEVVVNGKLTHEDYEHFLPKVERWWCSMGIFACCLT